MRIFVFIALLFFPVCAFAQEGNITVDLASDHVDITTGFNGTTLELFGVKRSEGDIAVVVRGPLRTMAVRRKDNVLGAWINRSSETFKRVPTYYNYAVSKDVDQLASPGTLKKYGIGPENLQFNKMNSDDAERPLFRAAMLRNKQKQGLYPEAPGVIKFIGPEFFRADFYVPSNVPVGEYEIQTIYLRNGVVKDVQVSKVRVAQVGNSAEIIKFSRNNSLLYGLLCVTLAVFAGWVSNRVRRG